MKAAAAESTSGFKNHLQRLIWHLNPKSNSNLPSFLIFRRKVYDLISEQFQMLRHHNDLKKCIKPLLMSLFGDERWKR